MTNQFAVPFNQDAANKAGGDDFIQEGGAYIVTIEEAKCVTAKTGSFGIEFTIKSDAGQSAKYISIYYQKQDQSIINGGYSTLCGIMYFLGLAGLNFSQEGSETYCKELQGKKIGLFLEKRLYTKNDGKESYSFGIRAPFNPDASNKLTVKEATDKSTPSSIDNWTASYKDKDERKTPQQPANTGDFGGHSNQFGNKFDNSDNIPFGQ